MLAEVRGYTSETINCPEGTDDLKVWETLVYSLVISCCVVTIDQYKFLKLYIFYVLASPTTVKH